MKSTAAAKSDPEVAPQLRPVSLDLFESVLPVRDLDAEGRQAEETIIVRFVDVIETRAGGADIQELETSA